MARIVKYREPVAGRGTAKARIVGPAAAPVHPIPARLRPRRILCIAAVVVEPVAAPLPDIAAHVEQAQFIRLLLAHGMGLAI